MSERPQRDFIYDHAPLADGRQRPPQWMRGIDLIAPIRADEKQMLRLGLNQDVFQQLERRAIEPLQVVEKQRQRMLGAREHTDQSPKRHLHPSLCVRRRDVRSGRLVSYDELELGHQVDTDLTNRLECVTKPVAPHAQLGLRLPEKLTNQTLQCLRQCGVRNVAPELIELTGREQPPWQNQHLVQLV